MTSFIFLVFGVVIILYQIIFDAESSIVSPHILFQFYFVIELNLNLWLGLNFNIPRFIAISRHTSGAEISFLIFVIFLAHICFLLSYFYLRKKNSVETRVVRWNRSVVNITSVLIMLSGYGAFYLLMQINGGFTNFQEKREMWRSIDSIGQGWVLFPATTLISMAACAICVNNVASFKNRYPIVKLFVLYFLSIVPAYFLGFRSFLLLPLFQFILYYHLWIKRIQVRYLIAPAIIFLVAFTIYGLQRELPFEKYSGSYPEYVADIYEKRPELIYIGALRVMGADVTQLTIDRTNMYGDYVAFYPSLVEAFTIPVPRSLWDGKPEPLSVRYSMEVMNLNGGISPTVPGEGYWHGGIIGVAILASVIGLIHALFYRAQRKSETNDNSALLMLSICPSIIMMAEAFQGYFNTVILILVAYFIMVRLFSMTPRKLT